MNSKSMEEEEAGKSKFAYIGSGLGLVRVEISNIERKPKYKLGLVLHDESREIPSFAGLFSHNNNIYLVGGVVDSDPVEDKIYHNDYFLLKFDHNEFQEFPPLNSMASFQFLQKIEINYSPMTIPRVVPAGVTTYFLHYAFLHRDFEEAYVFQSFNAETNCFVKHPNPPVPHGDYPHGIFLLGTCLYLFVADAHFISTIYTFNTISLESSQWKKNESLASQFHTKNIPAPFNHRGDVVLSDERTRTLDKTRIMVALCSGSLFAYRVRFVEGWESFELISSRFLEESHIPGPPCIDGWAHLTDFGGGRFCVIQGSEYTEFIMSVIRIDFEKEHEIQDRNYPKGMFSTTTLSYQEFNLEKHLKGLPLQVYPYIHPELCFLSAPPASPSTGKSSRKDDHEMTLSSAPPASPAKGKSSRKDDHKMTSSTAPPASRTNKRSSRN